MYFMQGIRRHYTYSIYTVGDMIDASRLSGQNVVLITFEQC